MPLILNVTISNTYRNGSGVKAKYFFPIIEKICHEECDRLFEINTQQTLERRGNILNALDRLHTAIIFREKIVNPNVKEVMQFKGSEDLKRLLCFDFSNIDTLLAFKSCSISWRNEKILIWKDELLQQNGMEFSVRDLYDYQYQYKLFPSLQNALNEISLSRGFFHTYTKYSICEQIKDEIALKFGNTVFEEPPDDQPNSRFACIIS